MVRRTPKQIASSAQKGSGAHKQILFQTRNAICVQKVNSLLAPELQALANVLVNVVLASIQPPQVLHQMQCASNAQTALLPSRDHRSALRVR